MVWIVSADIAGNEAERKARLQFIKDVTGDKSVSWKKITFFGILEFYHCMTNDGINGAFITSHNSIVAWFCRWPEIASKDFVVANTCIWEKEYDKNILYQMLEINGMAQLYYAKQVPELLNGVMVRYSNVINDVGTFGFMTSKSERILYRNRKKGLMEAVQCAFDLVVLEEAGNGKI